LVLFTYVTTHLANHALGNVSIPAMDAMLAVQKRVWQSLVGSVALYGSLVIHASLGLWSLYSRRYVGWTRLEVAQLLLGLCIPPMLVNHFTVTRLTLIWFGTEKLYPQELHALWIVGHAWGVLQLGVLVVAWSHACIGLWQAARLRAWFARMQTVATLAAVLLPTLAMLGFAQAVREEARAEAALGWHPPATRVDSPAHAAALAHARDVFLIAYVTALLAILAARLVRRWHETNHRGIAIHYPDGPVVRVPAGMSVLDASRLAGIRHAAVCGGRGRCSTCRVGIRVLRGRVPPPSAAERRVLAWVGLDPNHIRLACQLRPLGDIQVTPLVPPEHASEFVAGRAQRPGEERFVVAMFVDLRDSTRLAETRLPYDSMFLVSRFVSVVGRVISDAGGTPNQFTGDGVFALFGLDGEDEARACRAALDAVRRVSAAVQLLGRGAGEALRCGMGVHCGRAIVGDVGFGRHVTLTALGDVINVTARLERMTRDLDCEAIISEDVMERASVDADAGTARAVAIRGRTAMLRVRLLDPSTVEAGERLTPR
jgi:adenylate cyclase